MFTKAGLISGSLVDNKFNIHAINQSSQTYLIGEYSSVTSLSDLYIKSYNDTILLADAKYKTETSNVLNPTYIESKLNITSFNIKDGKSFEVSKPHLSGRIIWMGENSFATIDQHPTIVNTYVIGGNTTNNLDGISYLSNSTNNLYDWKFSIDEVSQDPHNTYILMPTTELGNYHFVRLLNSKEAISYEEISLNNTKIEYKDVELFFTEKAYKGLGIYVRTKNDGFFQVAQLTGNKLKERFGSVPNPGYEYYFPEDNMSRQNS